MKKKVARSAAKAVSRAPRGRFSRNSRLVLKPAAPEPMSPDEVSHLENLVKRFEDSEKAWQRMTAPDGDSDHWSQVEEHLLSRRDGDSDRRWKFFSK